jgi:hypothetical protein
MAQKVGQRLAKREVLLAKMQGLDIASKLG